MDFYSPQGSRNHHGLCRSRKRGNIAKWDSCHRFFRTKIAGASLALVTAQGSHRSSQISSARNNGKKNEIWVILESVFQEDELPPLPQLLSSPPPNHAVAMVEKVGGKTLKTEKPHHATNHRSAKDNAQIAYVMYTMHQYSCELVPVSVWEETGKAAQQSEITNSVLRKTDSARHILWLS